MGQSPDFKPGRLIITIQWVVGGGEEGGGRREEGGGRREEGGGRRKHAGESKRPPPAPPAVGLALG